MKTDNSKYDTKGKAQAPREPLQVWSGRRVEAVRILPRAATGLLPRLSEDGPQPIDFLVGQPGSNWTLGDQHSLPSKTGPRRPSVGFVMSGNSANDGLRNSKDLVDEDGATVIASPHTAKHN